MNDQDEAVSSGAQEDEKECAMLDEPFDDISAQGLTPRLRRMAARAYGARLNCLYRLGCRHSP